MAAPADMNMLRSLGDMESRTFRCDGYGMGGTETYIVNKENLRDFMGIGMGLLGGLTTNLPAVLDGYPGSYCRRVEAAFFNDAVDENAPGNKIAECDYYRATLQYEPGALQVTGDEDDQTVFEESLEQEARFITRPAASLFYFDDTATPPIAAGNGYPVGALGPIADFPMFTETYTCVVYGSRFAPLQGIVGNVNAQTLTRASINRVFAPETLLLQGCPTKHTVQADGTESFTITYRFSHNPMGWNRLPFPGRRDWYKLCLSNGDQFRPYTPVDFIGILPYVPV